MNGEDGRQKLRQRDHEGDRVNGARKGGCVEEESRVEQVSGNDESVREGNRAKKVERKGSRDNIDQEC